MGGPEPDTTLGLAETAACDGEGRTGIRGSRGRPALAEHDHGSSSQHELRELGQDETWAAVWDLWRVGGSCIVGFFLEKLVN